jgi:ring-1,2-phenylacetyl-CoA epoxidase subunit PaaA
VWGAEDWVDWDEFWQVVRGNGPMTSVRLLYRKAMWDTHAWVREVFAGIPAAPAV